MLKPGAAAIAGMMLVTGLSGCGAATDEADAFSQGSSTPSATGAPVASATQAASAAAPIQSRPAPAATGNPEWGDYTQDEFFFASLKGTWLTAEPPTADQLSAARYACEQLAAGTSKADIVAMTGDSEEAKIDNQTLVNISVHVYCPELDG